jgi:hypothetical protein
MRAMGGAPLGGPLRRARADRGGRIRAACDESITGSATGSATGPPAVRVLSEGLSEAFPCRVSTAPPVQASPSWDRTVVASWSSGMYIGVDRPEARGQPRNHEQKGRDAEADPPEALGPGRDVRNGAQRFDPERPAELHGSTNGPVQHLQKDEQADRQADAPAASPIAAISLRFGRAGSRRHVRGLDQGDALAAAGEFDPFARGGLREAGDGAVVLRPDVLVVPLETAQRYRVERRARDRAFQPPQLGIRFPDHALERSRSGHRSGQAADRAPPDRNCWARLRASFSGDLLAQRLDASAQRDDLRRVFGIDRQLLRQFPF